MQILTGTENININNRFKRYVNPRHRIKRKRHQARTTPTYVVEDEESVAYSAEEEEEEEDEGDLEREGGERKVELTREDATRSEILQNG